MPALHANALRGGSLPRLENPDLPGMAAFGKADAPALGQHRQILTHRRYKRGAVWQRPHDRFSVPSVTLARVVYLRKQP